MIVINGRFLSQRITGIQRFAYEICCALHQIGTDFVILSPDKHNRISVITTVILKLNVFNLGVQR